MPAALPVERSMSLAERVLAYLEVAEKKESDPWLRDDIRIAWITVRWAQSGVPAWSWHKDSPPYVAATYQVLHCHPDEVWTRVLVARRVNLGPEYSRFYPDELPLEAGLGANQSYRKECERRVASPTTCVNGDSLNTSARKQNISEIHGGNSDVRDADARVASDRVQLQNGDQADKARRRTLGVNSGSDAPPAGVAAPAEIPSPRKPCASERNPRWRKAA